MYRYQDIVVVCTRLDHSGTHVHRAIALAATNGARLSGLYLRRPVNAVGAPGMPELPIDLLAIEADLDAARKMEAEFQRIAGNGGVPRASWLVAAGTPACVLAYAGAAHDLAVLEAPADADVEMSLGVVEDIVLGAHSPCLIVPPSESGRSASFDRIAIGWNDSIEALRAMRAALPLLTNAGRVVLIRGEPRDYGSQMLHRPAIDPESYLRERGVQVSQRWLEAERKGGDGRRLLSEASEIGADLLVMGAYGHPRLREWMLGGVSRYVLRNVGPALLMCH